MITAIDTSVLLDVFLPDPQFGRQSLEVLKSCTREGALVISEIVYAELACAFKEERIMQGVLERSGIQLHPSDRKTLWKAGELWKQYRVRIGTSSTKQQRILADFWIGAHALLQADRLLTRDRGFYRDYFNVFYPFMKDENCR